MIRTPQFIIVREDNDRASAAGSPILGNYEVSSLSFGGFPVSITDFTAASSTEAANKTISMIFFFDNKTLPFYILLDS